MVLHHSHRHCRILTSVASVSLDHWDVLDGSACPLPLNPVLRLCNGHRITLQTQKRGHLFACRSNAMMAPEMCRNTLKWYPNSTILQTITLYISSMEIALSRWSPGL